MSKRTRDTISVTGQAANDPQGTDKKPICPECRRPVPTRGRPCDDCAITQQLRDLPDQVLEAAARNNPRDTHLTAELARRRAA